MRLATLPVYMVMPIFCTRESPGNARAASAHFDPAGFRTQELSDENQSQEGMRHPDRQSDSQVGP